MSQQTVETQQSASENSPHLRGGFDRGDIALRADNDNGWVARGYQEWERDERKKKKKKKMCVIL
jgi:hypothetical protein